MTAVLQPILTSDGMRAADGAAIDEWGVPGRVLMETAGRAVTDVIQDRFDEAARVAVLCGTGNNGGDGFVVARRLAQRGGAVVCVLAGEPATPDAQANLDLLRRLADDGASVEIADAPPSEAPDLVVDALLGIGVRGPLREPVRSLAAWAARQAAPVLAVDVPTGLDATTGDAAEDSLRADRTVALGALKAGLVLGDGPRLAGELHVVEIGIPEAALQREASSYRATDAWVGARLPHRAADAHKYSAGTALCVVGSRRYTGAAVLSTAAAYRAGAGAVVACTAEGARPVLDARALEVMVDGLPETDDGGLAGGLDTIRQRAASADAVLVGCGLGRAAETLALVRTLVETVEAPLVLDADGLAAFAGAADGLVERPGPLVVTPHLGELRRLLGDDSFSPSDRLGTVRQLAAAWDAVVVLKGMPSVVGVPDGRTFVGPPGHPALATAGTGDVLAGTVTGLLAQGLAPADAAVCALHLGTAAAERWAETRAASSLVASDLLDLMPVAARARFGW